MTYDVTTIKLILSLTQEWKEQLELAEMYYAHTLSTLNKRDRVVDMTELRLAQNEVIYLKRAYAYYQVLFEAGAFQDAIDFTKDTLLSPLTEQRRKINWETPVTSTNG